ncbi:hypothetical protein CONCODRAFT_21020 [Conidiobolus coronatus NRRL 28638]|uniref:Uncharacterized protein n=1 Tax=Conidiobolus coronatus (strain ATCC 28846 / CBS 209.66 / NRRL 28638) TaxID=796925 RepID=A0A137NPX0_CONC2|nr:hypothetical protein CONCODRAFT_21020 [Conidiobolus coronatus NRRL 28638]|eukprot:KXN64750.1 hypothetical protein CONCODRAFT_21020 [Conidiobolus coronatus NRRL 28638]
MSENKRINLHDIIFNVEFQNHLDFFDRNEISMVSKLAREKLKPIVFKRVAIHSANIKLHSNVFSMVFDNQDSETEYDYQALREENRGDIEASFNEINLSLIGINNHTKSLCLSRLDNVGYYLFL